MIPNIEALLARLDADFFKLSTEAAAALREQAREIEQFKADPLHTMLMMQSTHRLGEIHRFQEIVATQAATIEGLEKQVRLAAGMLSTTSSFADKHPEVALRFIQDAQVKDDAKMDGDKAHFTDGHGNDISHLVEP